jgi:hypothetical protein
VDFPEPLMPRLIVNFVIVFPVLRDIIVFGDLWIACMIDVIAIYPANGLVGGGAPALTVPVPKLTDLNEMCCHPNSIR